MHLTPLRGPTYHAQTRYRPTAGRDVAFEDVGIGPTPHEGILVVHDDEDVKLTSTASKSSTSAIGWYMDENDLRDNTGEDVEPSKAGSLDRHG